MKYNHDHRGGKKRKTMGWICSSCRSLANDKESLCGARVGPCAKSKTSPDSKVMQSNVLQNVLQASRASGDPWHRRGDCYPVPEIHIAVDILRRCHYSHYSPVPGIEIEGTPHPFPSIITTGHPHTQTPCLQTHSIAHSCSGGSKSIQKQYIFIKDLAMTKKNLPNIRLSIVGDFIRKKREFCQYFELLDAPSGCR